MGVRVCVIFLHMWIYSSIPSKGEKAALLIVDVQNAFVPGGTLPIQNGNDVIPVINKLRGKYESRFSIVVLTQDWHCSDHVSFASQHKNKKPSDIVYLQYNKKGQLCSSKGIKGNYAVKCSSTAHNISQTLWPDHAIIGTLDANFVSSLTHLSTDLVVRKGYHCQVDSYSAFYDNGGFGQTELHQKLQEKGITTVYVVGLANDYCAYYTSLDALKLKYKTYMVLDATRGIAPDSSAKAIADMKKKGVHVINTADISDTLPTSEGTKNSVQLSFFILGFVSAYSCLIPALH